MIIIPKPTKSASNPDTTAPDGSEIRFLIAQASEINGASMVEVSLGKGEVTRPVIHQTVEEIWYILEGAGQVWRCPPGQDPQTIEPCYVEPGNALSIPTHWSFQFSSTGEVSLKFLCITIPPWPGDSEAQPSHYGGLGTPSV